MIDTNIPECCMYTISITSNYFFLLHNIRPIECYLSLIKLKISLQLKVWSAIMAFYTKVPGLNEALEQVHEIQKS